MSSATCGTRSDVKASLTPKRRARVVENDQYAAFVRRVITAYSRRVAARDIDAISDSRAVCAHFPHHAILIEAGPKPPRPRVREAEHQSPALEGT